MSIAWDLTIHLSDLLLLGSGLVAFVIMVITQDRINNKLLQLLGDHDSGLIHDVTRLQGEVTVLEVWKAEHITMHEDLQKQLEEYRMHGSPHMRERVSKVEHQVQTVDTRLERMDLKLDHLIDLQLNRKG